MIDLTALATGSYHVEVADLHPGGGSGQYQVRATGVSGLLPGLTLISPEPGILTLSWSSSSAAVLQQSDTLEPGSWQTTPAAPHDDGYLKRIHVPTRDAPRRYFRLAEP